MKTRKNNITNEEANSLLDDVENRIKELKWSKRRVEQEMNYLKKLKSIAQKLF